MMNYILAFLIVGSFWSIVGFVAYQMRKRDNDQDTILFYILVALLTVLTCSFFIYVSIDIFLSLAESIK